MGRMVDDELIVVSEDENPMEELKNYTKRRKRGKFIKAKKSKSIFSLPKFSRD